MNFPQNFSRCNFVWITTRCAKAPIGNGHAAQGDGELTGDALEHRRGRPHSNRKASVGFTIEARNAGISEAPKAAEVNSNVAPAMASGSVGFT